MTRKAAFVASVYRHFDLFHVPVMEMLQREGYEVHAFAEDDYAKVRLQERGIICHDIPIARSPLKWSNISAARLLISHFKREQFQLLHVHTPVASILGRIAGRVANVPAVLYTAHGFHFYKGAPLPFWMLYYPVERVMSSWTDALITINREDFDRASNEFSADEVLYVPGVGVDIERFAPENTSVAKARIRAELNIAEDEHLVVCVAELNDNKNQMQLIEALPHLPSHLKVRCLLVGVGEHDVLLKKRAEELGVADSLHLLGYRLDVPDLIAASDVCTLLSKREGLPRFLLEAMATGRPILATNIRGSRDLVQDGETGYLVPVGDSLATANALERLLADEELRGEMGRTIRERVAPYRTENVVRELQGIYADVLRKKQSHTQGEAAVGRGGLSS
ncbi:glycosyltransferase family 4 protein [Tumebacillus sp. ITR2]|uniref:Glycosyltransferase family 4 protein n=1 Tax=Tumebacillus amylolyticus TaxID=2801339 RepID=A0ABS1JHM9_9BACL|nr:glycosyltransferase family 4 protein [Tumebacillus amylolyticus]MBL0389248.1 glycosyltransferase family 4 protein [Tumebacillus amylolyticus]